MDENASDLVEQLHRAAVQRHWAEEERGRALVLQVHREEIERCLAEHQRLDELTNQLHREAAARASLALLPPAPALTVHFTELPDATPDSPLYREWNTYRREAGRLLREGCEGRHVLIKDEQIIGLWDTHDAAMTAGYRQFRGQPFLVHEVQERERVLGCVTTYQCRNLRLPSRLAS
jgi:hypothetical protein